MNRTTLLTIACLASCAASISSEQVVGTYVAKYSYGEEELEVRPDHTYQQRITLNYEARQTTHSGRWSYDESGARLALQDALLLDDNFGKVNPTFKKPSDGAWVLAVKRHLGKMTLNWNDDLGVRFEKK